MERGGRGRPDADDRTRADGARRGDTARRQQPSRGAIDPAVADRERRALLDAAAALIEEQGFAYVDADAIAARANVEVHVFHSHFRGMGALLRALSARFTEQMLTVIEQSTQSGIWAGAAARDVVEVAVRSILDVVIERKALVGAFLSNSTTDPQLAADLRKVGTHIARRVVATFAECRNVPARPARSVAFSLLLTASIAHHHILVGDGWTGVSFTPEQLTEEATRAICAYLGFDETPAPHDSISHLQTNELPVVRFPDDE